MKKITYSIFLVSFLIIACCNKNNNLTEDLKQPNVVDIKKNEISGKQISFRERTFSMIKPTSASNAQDVNKIQAIIKNANFEIVKYKKVLMTNDLFNKLYGIHKGKHFFKELQKSILNKHVIVQILEGENAIERYRKLMGQSNIANAEEGTLRKIFGKDNTNNAVHGSDSIENAEKEICIFFKESCKNNFKEKKYNKKYNKKHLKHIKR